MRTGRVGARIAVDARDTVVGQRQSRGTRATIEAVLVDTVVRALVVPLRALVDILALSSLRVLTQSRRTRWVLARQTVLQERQTIRTDASVASHRIRAIVRTVVLVLEALVEILASPPVTFYDESLRATTLERVPMFLADVRAIGQTARADCNARSLVIRCYRRSGGTPAFVRTFNVDTLVRTLMSAFETLVHILASLRVVGQQETGRTAASKSPFFVRTLVRTSVFIVRALVYVSAVEIVRGQFVSLAARATVATNRVHANLIARVSNV